MRFRGIVGGLVLLILLAPLFCYWAIFLRIKYRLLPPVPRYTARYSVRDVGAASTDWTAFYEWNGEHYSWRLNNQGQVFFDEPQGKQREALQKALFLRRARDLGLGNSQWVRAVNGRFSVVMEPTGIELWQGSGVRTRTGWKMKAYPKWPVYDMKMPFLFADGTAVGNGRIATAPASSGGMVEPHGRAFPLWWNGKSSDGALDLNGLIAPQSGWYLQRALAVNARGQTLCLGHHSNAQGAEKPDWKTLRRLLLTPV